MQTILFILLIIGTLALFIGTKIFMWKRAQSMDSMHEAFDGERNHERWAKFVVAVFMFQLKATGVIILLDLFYIFSDYDVGARPWAYASLGFVGGWWAFRSLSEDW